MCGVCVVCVCVRTYVCIIVLRCLLPYLSSGKKVAVKDLQEEAVKPSFSHESAHDFLKNHFFGVRLERTPGIIVCTYVSMKNFIFLL